MHTDKKTSQKIARVRPIGFSEAAGHARMDDGNAFIPDPQTGPAHSRDDLAEMVAEDFLSSATSGEEVGEEVRNQVVPEELGGPFVPSNADDELAEGTDAANPADAEVEPFPRAVGGR
jgi:hypothetical protein